MGNLNLVKDLIINIPRLTFFFPWVGMSIFNFHKGKKKQESMQSVMGSGGMQRFPES